jgi:serine/threonine protein kinase
MLKVDPKERIKASEILKHPYISNAESTSEKELLSPASTVCSSRAMNFAEAEQNF